MNLVGCGGIVADASDVVLVYRHFQILFVSGGTHIKEQLSDFLIQGHSCNGVLHPFTILVR